MHLCVPRPTENISEAQRYTLRITAFYKLLSFFRFCLLCEFTALFFQIKATLYEIIYKHMFQCTHLLFITLIVWLLLSTGLSLFCLLLLLAGKGNICNVCGLLNSLNLLILRPKALPLIFYLQILFWLQ